MVEVFSAAWAAAWRERINQSRGYRRAGARWDDTIAFVMSADPSAGVASERGVLLDLSLGECRDARVAGDGELESASFVIAAGPETWRRVFSGRLDIVMAIMQKRFSLRRGTMAELLPHASAAHELLAAARGIDAEFPTSG
jgi:putative sterol carrier protein